MARARNVAEQTTTRAHSASRATLVIDGQEVTFEDAFSGIDRSVEPSLHYGTDDPAVWFTTDHRSPWDFSLRATTMGSLDYSTLAAAVAAIEQPRAIEPDLVHPELYARLQARLAPHVGQVNTAERRTSIGHAIHAELEQYMRAGVQPHDHNDDRVDALVYAYTQLEVRRPPQGLFGHARNLRSALVDLLTTPDGFPFVA